MMHSALPRFHFESALLPKSHCFEVVREGVGAAFDMALHDTSRPVFELTADVWMLGQILLNSRRVSSVRMDRTHTRARRDGIDHYLVIVTRSGGWVAETDGVTVLAPAGSVVVFDMARPIKASTQDNVSVGCTIPRDALDRLLPDNAVKHGAVLGGGAAALLADYLAALERRLPQISSAEAPFIERATYDMMAACIAPSTERVRQAGSQVAASLRRQARRVVDARLGDSSLSPDDLALALGVSRATLYRVFEPEGGVAAFIRARRLQQAARLLANGDERRRISELAYACGFESDAHFSRAFRQAFDATPSEVRAGHIALPPSWRPEDRDVTAQFQRWLRTLAA